MENNVELPIKLQMALAHNEKSFKAFLNMDEKSQKEIIQHVQGLSSVRQINIFVNSLPKLH